MQRMRFGIKHDSITGLHDGLANIHVLNTHLLPDV